MKGFLPICIEGVEVGSTVISYVKNSCTFFFIYHVHKRSNSLQSLEVNQLLRASSGPGELV